MKVRTLKAAEYRGCKVYYRNFGNDFEYLAVIKGEIYTARVTIVKEWWQMLLRRDYTDKQLLDATNYIARFAETTIDHVLDNVKS